MNIEEKVREYKAILRKNDALSHAMGVLQYDQETVMPKGAADDLATTFGVLSEEMYKLATSPETTALVAELFDARGSLDEITRREVEEQQEETARIACIPINEFVEFQMLQSKASAVWRDAKVNNDFESFRPYLEEIVRCRRQFALYYAPDKDPYDTLLDSFEKGLDRKTLDIFFGRLADAFRPLVAELSERNASIRDDFLSRIFPVEGQRKLSDAIMDLMCIDRNYCNIGEVEHPFTTNFSKHDVRITTHYHEDAVASSFYSVVHEGGHALYELHTGDELIGSPLASGASMGMHESQSRLFENIIGRSEAFIRAIYPKMTELFPDQLADVSAFEFFRAVNKSTPSLIRTESDELTYPFHIMIRYELEKRLIGGTLAVADLPAEWNRLYKEYLGVDVPNDTCGVLQDSHWSGGMIGYFPSYAIGSAYGAQILASMKKGLDIDGCISGGDLHPVIDWLTDKIWKYGCLKHPDELIRNACGAPFDPQFYIDYISEKMHRVYGF